jgi:hypothetical protein
MEDGTPDPWVSVDEMLKHLDSCFQNYYAAEEAENSFFELKMQPGENFNTFHTEFSRLGSVGRVPVATWRSHLWRKLNREFSSKLLATIHFYPTYPEVVKECQRIAMELKQHHHIYPMNPRPARAPKTTPTAALPAHLSGPPFGSVHRVRPGILVDRSTPKPDRQRSFTPRPQFEQKDKDDGNCFGCGEPGHLVKDCPNKTKINEIATNSPQEEEAADSEVTSDEDDQDQSAEN